MAGTSLVVQWLRLRAFTAGGADSIPGRGTKILHAVGCCQKKIKIYCSSQKSRPELIVLPLCCPRSAVCKLAACG